MAAWPAAEAAFHLERLRQPGVDAGSLEGALTEPSPESSGLDALGLLGMGLAAVSMVGALVLMVPVAWSYIVVKRRVGYDQAVVHALLILPVAVAGIVIIVHDEIALAFSLAGIVAAVRFRTTLDDTKDAVYVFLAIGVGLAAGVQALGIAFVLSLVFNGLNLALWSLGFGNIYLDQGSRTGHLTLGDVLAGPGSAERAVAFGDRRLLDAMSRDEVKEMADRVGRMERYLQVAAETRRERKSYSVLLVHSAAAGEVQQAIEPSLDRLCVRWSLAEIIPREDGVSVLEYLVRPRDDVAEGTLMEAVRTAGGAAVRAAEMRSLRALAKRLD